VPRRGRLKTVAGFLPGAITLGNVLAGFSAIMLASMDRFFIAAVLILAAGILDGLDGRVARLTGTTSSFGEQLDSLADAISFTVAPSVLAFHLGVGTLGRFGWGACFLFTACGVIRLARFNAFTRTHHDFIGLPTPAAAATITCPILLVGGAPLPEWFPAMYGVLVLLVALLMISPFRYRAFKDLRFGPKPYRALALWAAILAGLIFMYEWFVPALILAYLVSPLTRNVVRLLRGKQAAPRREDARTSERTEDSDEVIA
jgi:CDP-diacylglycerol--serine O-phosphatidyltransferase